MDEMIYLGSHIGLTGPNYYLDTVKEALSYGANTFMFYTGAPQNSYRKDLKELKIEEGRALIRESGLNEEKIIVHAPYIINGANSVKEDIFDLAKQLIIQELRRTEAFGVKSMVLHPGAHVGAGSQVGIHKLVECLNDVFSKDGTNVKISLETMAGKGNEIGRNLKEVASILSLAKHKERLGVWLDSCHLNDAGYDLRDKEAFIAKIEETIGLDKVLVIHLNDSKNPIASHKDRHENIGYGSLGYDVLLSIAQDKRFEGIPKILETPWVNEKPPYEQEIKMLQSGSYIDSWRESL